MPNTVCRSIQDHSVGRPIKVREHRKHRVKEKSSRKLSSELLARTNGVSLWVKKISVAIIVRKIPSREKVANIIPRISLYARNSTGFGMQASLWLFDQYSGGHLKHCNDSAKQKGKKKSNRWFKKGSESMQFNVYHLNL